MEIIIYKYGSHKNLNSYGKLWLLKLIIVFKLRPE